MHVKPDGWLELFLQDAARWIIPEEIGDPDSLTPKLIARLLFQHPPLRAMAWMRLGGYLRERGVRGVSGYVQRRLLRVYGLEVRPGRHIAGGCYIAHPVGCTLRAGRIGSNVTIVGRVTMGANKELTLSPVLRDNVFLGVGCTVLGPITLGNNVKVGAHAVVLKDVPDNTTVVGIPAKPVSTSLPAGDA